MSSTKNTEQTRKVVRATYYEVFKVPKGVDLEDNKVVEDWYVNYNTLHIKYVGKEDVEEIDPEDLGYKTFDFPDDEFIDEDEDEYDEEEEEEEEEEQGDQDEEN